MSKISDYRTSNYLTQKDVIPPIKVTIAGYTEEDFDQNGKKKKKAVFNFKEKMPDGSNVKPLVMNIVNMQRIEQMTGSEEFADWIGTVIVLYSNPDVTNAQGETVGGIRIRAPKQAQPQTQTTAQARKDIEAHAAKRAAEMRIPEPDPEITEPEYDEPGADDEP